MNRYNLLLPAGILPALWTDENPSLVMLDGHSILKTSGGELGKIHCPIYETQSLYELPAGGSSQDLLAGKRKAAEAVIAKIEEHLEQVVKTYESEIGEPPGTVVLFVRTAPTTVQAGPPTEGWCVFCTFGIVAVRGTPRGFEGLRAAGPIKLSDADSQHGWSCDLDLSGDPPLLE